MEQWYEVDFDVENVKGYRPSGTHASAIKKDIVNADTDEAIPYFVVDEKLRRARLTVDRDGILGDRLSTTGGQNWLILNLRTYEAIKEVRICPSVRWIPLEVLSTKGKLLAEYQWAYGARDHDVWDLERSDCLWVDVEKGEGKKLATIHKAVLFAKKAPPYDLFFADSIRWVCTQAFKDLVEKISASGFLFGLLDVTR